MNSFPFRVGNIECIAINDGDTTYRASDYVVNASPDAVQRALATHGDERDNIPSPYSGLLVRTASHLVLIDTGAGDLTPTVGKLLGNLRAAGVEPAEIDTVILTHGQPDHIGGNVGADGKPVFPNARHVTFRAEWDYWTDEGVLARHAPVFGAPRLARGLGLRAGAGHREPAAPIRPGGDRSRAGPGVPLSAVPEPGPRHQAGRGMAMGPNRDRRGCRPARCHRDPPGLRGRTIRSRSGRLLLGGRLPR
ncbi:MAG TPA: MBL fold metallo-hydrolase [Candidatus Limnocylindria bacterium]|nr:MBL fold metallo-hydrolase [Candidatus Limnocylindria bacterium]